ncbi:threonine 3-dehydrogenase [Propionivibrio dicarboxylicus]|uniref:Threonine 3-dehydrogenase n=2 Tax=Propionivibrio dicarboxylicus TaxID=83767 RepID=A0A1G7Z2R5_9RHOO|nr:threonine 3-dehydrogenase [Propionivibrio dicarboxylicus]
MYALIKETKAFGAEYREVEEKSLAAGEIRIAVEAAAICGTDIHYYKWDQAAENFASAFNVELPLILGHEFAGSIVEVGPGVEDKKVGDRVAIETHIPCGKCYQCQNGDAHNCNSTGIYGTTCDGAFADFAIAPASVAFKLPPSIETAEGALFEPAGVAMRGIDEANIKPGETVLIYGCGPIAIFAIQMARVCGAGTVIAVDINGYRVDMARKFGAVGINSTKDDVYSEVMRIAAARGGVDVVLELTGSPAVYKTVFDLIRREGRLVTIGHPPGEVPINFTKNVNLKGLSVKGIFGRRIWNTWWQLSGLVAGKKLDLMSVVTHRYKYEQHQEAFDMTAGNAGKILFMK